MSVTDITFERCMLSTPVHVHCKSMLYLLYMQSCLMIIWRAVARITSCALQHHHCADYKYTMSALISRYGHDNNDNAAPVHGTVAW